MDLLIACTGLGLTLLATHDPDFETTYPYFRLALLFAVSGFGTALGSIYLSRLSDRFGRKPMLLVSLAGIIALSLLFAAATRWWHLFGLIVVRSSFMGMFWPSLEARITDGAEGREMTRRLGWFGIAFCLGLLVGYPLGGFFSDEWVRAPFYAGAAAGLVLLGVLIVSLRQDQTHDGHRPAPVPEGLEPESVRRALRLRPVFVLSAWIANACSYASASILRSIFPRFATLPPAERGLDFTGLESGVIVSGVSAASLLTFILLGKYPFWHYRFRYLIGGQFLCVLACVLFATCSGLFELFGAAFLFGVGAGVVYISSIYYSLDRQGARAGQSGMHEGVLCFGFCGGMILTALVMRLLPSHHRVPYWICVAILVGGMLAQAILYAGARRSERE
jgi:MFS family permease